ncbi:hypothetical protein C8J57DRAFT_1535352 [Mycena rebaudengoi]|nr:hypothetical protein C8J57DRAFT_1535352 [Mycena rebaudengoi]
MSQPEAPTVPVSPVILFATISPTSDTETVSSTNSPGCATPENLAKCSEDLAAAPSATFSHLTAVERDLAVAIKSFERIEAQHETPLNMSCRRHQRRVESLEAERSALKHANRQLIRDGEKQKEKLVQLELDLEAERKKFGLFCEYIKDLMGTMLVEPRSFPDPLINTTTCTANCAHMHQQAAETCRLTLGTLQDSYTESLAKLVKLEQAIDLLTKATNCSLSHLSPRLAVPTAVVHVHRTRTPRAMRCATIHSRSDILRDYDVAPNALYRPRRPVKPTRSPRTLRRWRFSPQASLSSRPRTPHSLPPIPPRGSKPTLTVHRESRRAPLTTCAAQPSPPLRPYPPRTTNHDAHPVPVAPSRALWRKLASDVSYVSNTNETITEKARHEQGEWRRDALQFASEPTERPRQAIQAPSSSMDPITGNKIEIDRYEAIRGTNAEMRCSRTRLASRRSGYCWVLADENAHVMETKTTM